MQIVDIREAETTLHRLIEMAIGGEVVVIAVAGEPVARLTACGSPMGADRCRLGFMDGLFTIPEDFDSMGAAEIEDLFEPKSRPAG